MHRWWQFGIRSWRAKPGRMLVATAAIALGVSVVVWVTTSYESVRVSLNERVWAWVGVWHISAQSPLGHWGVIQESTIEKIRNVPGVEVVAGRLMRRVHVADPGKLDIDAAVAKGQEDGFLPMQEFDAIGIDPNVEQAAKTYANRFEGRRLRPGDKDAAIVERRLANTLGVGIGDSIYVLKQRPNKIVFAPKREDLERFKIIGLFHRRSMGNMQRPAMVVDLAALQRTTFHDGWITAADVLLENPSREEIERVAARIKTYAKGQLKGFTVETGIAKLEKLRQAEKQTRFVLLLIAFIALYTAFFIVMSTVSMGMVERVRQLGLLRCLGMTRGQVTGLVLIETIPLGVAGTIFGIPLGIGLAWLCFLLLPHIGYAAISPTAHEDMAISVWGIWVGVIGGLCTTFLGGLLPALQANRVSPLDASRPEAQVRRRGAEWSVGMLGAAMIAGHWAMAEYLPPFWWLDFKWVGLLGVTLVFAGYALLTPLAMKTLGYVGVSVTSVVIGVRRPLLAEHVGRASWRSGLICCGLMVGLSLMVCTVVHTQSIIAGWDFPKALAEAFVWTASPAKPNTIEKLKKIPGVKRFTLVNDIPCELPMDRSPWEQWVRPVFAAGNLDSFLSMVEVAFLEGDRETAIEALRKGGAVLVTPEYASTRNKKLGDVVRVTVGNRTAAFRIVGIVESPALDIAANFFNTTGHLMLASVGAVLGTFEDAKEKFGVEGYTLALLDFDLPDIAIPPEWDEKKLRSRKALGMFQLVDPEAMSRDELFRWAREQGVLRRVQTAMGRNSAVFGSIRELKRAIDRDIRMATALFASIPAVALITAALGVANLMMANVTSRSRQIAILRAIGATRWQITRLVVGEALVLASISAGMGLLLGFHAAYTVNQLTEKLWGFVPVWDVPWGFVGLALAFTTVVCLVAGIMPARHAARSNVLAALQAT